MNKKMEDFIKETEGNVVYSEEVTEMPDCSLELCIDGKSVQKLEHIKAMVGAIRVKDSHGKVAIMQLGNGPSRLEILRGLISAEIAQGTPISLIMPKPRSIGEELSDLLESILNDINSNTKVPDKESSDSTKTAEEANEQMESKNNS